MTDTNTISPVDMPAVPSDEPGGRASPRAPWATLGLGLVSGIGASLCCLPMLFLLAGAGGAWMGTLTAMERYQPYFLGLAVVFLGLSFRKLYLVRRRCPLDAGTASTWSVRRQRGLFWLVVVTVGLLVGVPWYVPRLLG